MKDLRSDILVHFSEINQRFSSVEPGLELILGKLRALDTRVATLVDRHTQRNK